MQQTNFIQIDGWVTKARNGFIWFHHQKPRIRLYQTIEQDGDEVKVIRNETEWSSDGNFHCLGTADDLNVELTSTVALEATMCINLKKY